jgi:uncharacterized repeat protein (TIGR01451 family)
VGDQLITVAGCGTNLDYFVVIGSNPCDGTVTNYSATCTNIFGNTPCMAVVKNCGPAAVANGAPYQVSGYVTNCGTGPLTSVTVVDVVTDPDGIKTTNNVNLGGVTTVLGGTALSFGPITITPTKCGPYSDYFISTANGLCSNPSAQTSATCVTTNVCTPVICVTKGVLCGAAQNTKCDPNQTYLKSDTGVNGAAFCYRIVVANCGPVTLTNVQVSDSLLGPLVDFPTTLVSGQAITNTYSLSYTNGANGPATNVNIVTAFGTGGSDTSGNPITVTNNDSAIAIVEPISVNCSITLNSSLDLDGNANDNHVFLPPIDTNALVGYTLTICNNGQVDLSVALSGVPSLVSCSDVTTSITVPATTNVLAGQCITISGCVSVACPGMTNQVAVMGTAIASTNVPCIYDSNGNPVTTTNSTCIAVIACDTPPPPTPKICVTKEIKCYPASPLPNPICDPTDTYYKTDTGVNGAAFCYRVIVSNCGIVSLTNITVWDDNPLNQGGLGHPVQLDFSSCAPLLPGQSCTNTYWLTSPGSSWGPKTNVNTVTATGIGNGITTNATDRATNVVVPIGVSCQTTLYSSFNMTNCGNGGNQCDVVLPSDITNAPVQVVLTINNTGMADLSVAISGLPQLVDCDDDHTALQINNPTNIPAGQSITIVGCVLVSCPGGTNLPISVQGTAIASATVPCIYDANGNAKTTAVSQCPVCVSCCQPVSCRVTGGGTLYAGDVSHNCIDVVTTLSDDNTSATVDHISHGGQLGAPFSQMDCATRLANPCIRGEWEHVRHYDNKQNGLQDAFDMNFHSANPNITGHFDTLMCACLPCCYNGTNYVGNQQPPPGWSHKKFQVCNPDDRRICGPLPSPAPANAIIFTGIGTFTPQVSSGNGKNAQKRYVIFRVYIEDRSEPGGIHPGGAKMPGTIYCFQAWDTGIATTKKADFSNLMQKFRMDLGADSCAFLTSMSNGSLPPGSLPPTSVNGIAADVVDQGPLHDGSQQIHPSTGATCTQ